MLRHFIAMYRKIRMQAASYSVLEEVNFEVAHHLEDDEEVSKVWQTLSHVYFAYSFGQSLDYQASAFVPL